MTRTFGLLMAVAFGAIQAAQWTVGVYMCADNGLSDQAYLDLAEMMQVGSTEEVNVVVQVDNAARDTHPECRRYRVVKDGLEALGELGELDMADTAVLRDFAGFLRRSFPANNYFLILWDHGNGWPEGYGPACSIFIDESHGHSMGVAGGELAAAVDGVCQALGTGIRVLGFDACLMGMIEVAAEVQGDCDYLLASEGLVPWGGWPYDELLALLVARPTLTPREFLPQMCAAYLAEFEGEDVCLSALDMTQLARLLPAMAATIRDSLDLLDPGFGQARSTVQTFPSVPGRPPCPGDDNVDLAQYWELAPGDGTGMLRSVLLPLVVANRAAGAVDEARGVAVWFPQGYLGFKSSAASYRELAFADSVPWLQFLNTYYGVDDVKPSQPKILRHVVGGRGDIRLWWSSSVDIAPVDYYLYEVESLTVEFEDYCDDLSEWSSIGWLISEEQVHSPPGAFFSGSASNLDNWLVLVNPWSLPQGGLLSCYVYFDTEEATDSSGVLRRDICYIDWSENKVDWQPVDSLYGSGTSWQERRYLLPQADGLYLRFRYLTNDGDNRLGVFVDDVRVTSFGCMRQLAGGIGDTTFYVFNAPYGGYSYLVCARDSFGNVSMASQLYPSGEPVRVESYAEPHTRPAPFSGSCQLVVDFPEGATPDVFVYTVSGTLVRRFERVGSKSLAWNGKNEADVELAEGMYLVLVRSDGFTKVGKIAKTGRSAP